MQEDNKWTVELLALPRQWDIFIIYYICILRIIWWLHKYTIELLLYQKYLSRILVNSKSIEIDVMLRDYNRCAYSLVGGNNSNNGICPVITSVTVFMVCLFESIKSNVFKKWTKCMPKMATPPHQQLRRQQQHQHTC